MQKRGEVKHAKIAKAMASRTKDNMQFYTKEKLNRFVAQEKEREQKKIEKEERKYQRQLEKARQAELKAAGKSEQRPRKHHKEKKKAKPPEIDKPIVGVTVVKKQPAPATVAPKPKPKPRNRPPPMDFNALIRLANEKLQNGEAEETTPEVPEEKNERPLTQAEKDRQERLRSKEYQAFLKKGGKRPEFGDGAKNIPKSNLGIRCTLENNSTEEKGSNKHNWVAKKTTAWKSMLPARPAPKSSQNVSSAKSSGKLNGDTAAPANVQVNETVIQCRPAKTRSSDLKRRRDSGDDPFDRAMRRQERRGPAGV